MLGPRQLRLSQRVGDRRTDALRSSEPMRDLGVGRSRREGMGAALGKGDCFGQGVGMGLLLWG
jgi:hypothetical protein